jgi:methanogenic corrinoid protein MtbC1
MPNENLLPIKVVAKKTGLTPYVIRAWEKRYQAISPTRNNTNRRFYNEEEVSRLLLLSQAIQNGFSIGQIAQLPDQQILSMLKPKEENSKNEAIFREKTNLAQKYLEDCFSAIVEMDAQTLDKLLTKAQIELSLIEIIEDLVVALLHKLGILWQNGELRIVQEHIASAVIRSFLGRLNSELHPSSVAPNLVVATPIGQIHELGALIATLTAAYEGWKAIYLGVNLPAEEIAKAVEQHNTKVIALSIIYPNDDPYLHLELKKLRTLLGKKVNLIVGGQSATGYQQTLNSIQAKLITNLKDFRSTLLELRSSNA